MPFLPPNQQQQSTEGINTHTHQFNGPFSGTTRVGRYQKGKTNLDFTEARDSEWQWHQLGHMQVCTSLPIDSHASTSPLSFFADWMPFLSPNQQCQSTEGIKVNINHVNINHCLVQPFPVSCKLLKMKIGLVEVLKLALGPKKVLTLKVSVEHTHTTV